MLKNVLIAQSGGPTASINATLSGIIARCLESDSIGEIYGALHGLDGILSGKLVNLRAQIKNGDDLKLLSITPAMALGTCRRKLPDIEADPVPYLKIKNIFNQYGIGYFFYIGGNDSMDTAMKIDEYLKNCGDDIKVIGIPKTIDNDLMMTDHAPGYGSAAKYVATTMLEIGRDCSAYNIPAVTIVEIMGRNTGWLAAAAAVPRYFGEKTPHLIYLPEAPFDCQKFMSDLYEQFEHTKGVIIAISEGVVTDTACAARLMQKEKDGFGHPQIAGNSFYLEQLVKEEIGCKTRCIQLSLMQRCAARHASRTDIEESILIGEKATEYALGGHTGKFVYFVRTDNPYGVRVDICDLKLVANKEKKFPREWINEDGNGILDEGVHYILPLINGSIEIQDNGYIPNYFRLDLSAMV
jgi:6-phosphofructokinase